MKEQSIHFDSMLAEPNKINQITAEEWKLWFMIKKDRSQAFFLLEGVRDNRRLAQVIQLKPDIGSKAVVEMTDINFANMAEFKKLCANCVGKAYDFSNPDHAGEFESLIRDEHKRARSGQINYDERADSRSISEKRGNSVSFMRTISAETDRAEHGMTNYEPMAGSKFSGCLAASLEASESEAALMSSRAQVHASKLDIDGSGGKAPAGAPAKSNSKVTYLAVEFLSALINHGHNSCTWAEAVLRVVTDAPLNTKRLEVVTINPAILKQYGAENELNADSQQTTCLIF